MSERFLIKRVLSPCRRVYTADQSRRSAAIIPDVEGSVPEPALPVPDPADLYRSTESGKQSHEGLFQVM